MAPLSPQSRFSILPQQVQSQDETQISTKNKTSAYLSIWQNGAQAKKHHAPGPYNQQNFRRNEARFLLLVVSALYASELSFVKKLNDTIPVGISLVLRFGLASLAVLPLLCFDSPPAFPCWRCKNASRTICSTEKDKKEENIVESTLSSGITFHNNTGRDDDNSIAFPVSDNKTCIQQPVLHLESGTPPIESRDCENSLSTSREALSDDTRDFSQPRQYQLYNQSSDASSTSPIPMSTPFVLILIAGLEIGLYNGIGLTANALLLSSGIASASELAFVGSLSTVFVPMLEYLVVPFFEKMFRYERSEETVPAGGKRMKRRHIMGVLLALTGLFFLEGPFSDDADFRAFRDSNSGREFESDETKSLPVFDDVGLHIPSEEVIQELIINGTTSKGQLQHDNFRTSGMDDRVSNEDDDGILNVGTYVNHSFDDAHVSQHFLDDQIETSPDDQEEDITNQAANKRILGGSSSDISFSDHRLSDLAVTEDTDNMENIISDGQNSAVNDIDAPTTGSSALNEMHSSNFEHIESKVSGERNDRHKVTELGTLPSLLPRVELRRMLCLIPPIMFALGFYKIEHAMEKYPSEAKRLSAVHIFGIFLVTLFFYYACPQPVSSLTKSDPYTTRPEDDPSLSSTAQVVIWLTTPTILFQLFWSGVISIALGIYLEALAMKTLSATESVLIFSSEPIFASAIASWFLGEAFLGGSYWGVLGAGFIVAGCLVSELGDHSILRKSSWSFNMIEMQTPTRWWKGKKHDAVVFGEGVAKVSNMSNGMVITSDNATEDDFLSKLKGSTAGDSIRHPQLHRRQ